MKKFIKVLQFIFLLPLLPIIGIEGAGGSAGGSTGGGAAGDNGGGTSKGEGEGGDKGGKAPEKTHTQAEVDKIVSDRVTREQKKYQRMLDDMKKQMGGDTSGTAPGSDGQGGTDDNGQAATAQAAQQLVLANQRLVNATALGEALKLGVDPKYTADVVRLADLSKVEVKEDGTMDTGVISKALDDVLKRVPVFKSSVDTSGGFKVGGEGAKPQGNTSGWGNKTQSQGQPGATKSWNRQNR